MKSKKNVLQFILSLIIVIACLYYLFEELSWSDFSRTLKETDLRYVMLAFIFMTISFIIRITRWKYLLISIKDISFRRLLSPMFIGFMANILPARAGEFLRAWILQKREKSVPFTAAFGSVVLERVFDMMTILLFMTFFLLFGDLTSNHNGGSDKIMGLVHKLGNASILLLIILSGFVWCVYKYPDKIAIMGKRILNPLSQKFADIFESLIQSFSKGFSVLDSFKRLMIVFVLSFFVWVFSFISLYVLLYAFPGSVPQNPFSASGLLLIAITGSTFVPSPGYIGPYQVACQWVLSEHYGFSKAVGVGYGLLHWSIGMVPIIVIGIIFLYLENISLKDISSIKEGAKKNEDK